MFDSVQPDRWFGSAHPALILLVLVALAASVSVHGYVFAWVLRRRLQALLRAAELDDGRHDL